MSIRFNLEIGLLLLSLWPPYYGGQSDSCHKLLKQVVEKQLLRSNHF